MMTGCKLSLLVAVVSSSFIFASAWIPQQHASTRFRQPFVPSTILSSSLTELHLSSNAPQRRPRRSLQKRRRRSDKKDDGSTQVINPNNNDNGNDILYEEIRPLVSSRSKELGVDYWIDEAELRKEKERLARKPPEPGQIPDEKLWSEVLSPYKQNWIGIISVVIVLLATIITQFPELLNTPSIEIPDL